MTRENAKQLLPIIQAYAEGKTIEFFEGPSRSKSWKPIKHPHFSEVPHRYRIAPEKPAPPLWSRPEHVPLGAWIRSRADSTQVWLLSGASAYYVFTTGWSKFYTSLGDYEHSTDQGKTWKPCTVAEGSV